MSFTIRRAAQDDRHEWVRMRHELWPEAPHDYLWLDVDAKLADENKAVFIASTDDEQRVAFVEVGLHNYAEGCDTSPVGYIEAWYVDPHVRGQKLGRELINIAEQWAREKGVTEMASDTWLDNHASIQAHLKMGYSEVDRLVHFVKKL